MTIDPLLDSILAFFCGVIITLAIIGLHKRFTKYDNEFYRALLKSRRLRNDI